MFQTLFRQETATKTKQKNNTHKKTNKSEETSSSCREDVGNREETAKTLKDVRRYFLQFVTHFSVFFFLFVAENFASKMKSRDNLKT